jgi:hypothetical protein
MSATPYLKYVAECRMIRYKAKQQHNIFVAHNVTFDAISKQLSDHNPILDGYILQWNVMMRGNQRFSRDDKRIPLGFNNGLGLIESTAQYQKRIQQLAHFLAAVCFVFPEISLISLCEAPIENVDLNIFFNTLKSYSHMEQQFNLATILQQDKTSSPWGLLLLTSPALTAQHGSEDAFLDSALTAQPQERSKLRHRLFFWQVQSHKHTLWFVQTHLPYSGQDETATQVSALSPSGQTYVQLFEKIIKNFADQFMIAAGDFNLLPYLLVAHNPSLGYRQAIPKTINSIESSDKGTQPRLVDAIIHSPLIQKMRFNAQLNSRENKLLIEWVCRQIIAYVHQQDAHQKPSDKSQYAMTKAS